MEILIATLGSEPQVVTLTLDLLLAAGHTPRRLQVLHTHKTGYKMEASLASLKEELNIKPYPGLASIDFVVLRDRRGRPLPDLKRPEHNNAAFRALYDLVFAAKEAGHHIHLSAAGGRKAMAMYALLAAQLLFDGPDSGEVHDHLWLLWSKIGLRKKRNMHALPGDATLVKVPVLSWRTGFVRKQTFVSSLTPALKEVLRLNSQGLSYRQIAEKRITSTNTVDSQLRELCSRFEAEIGFASEGGINAKVLRSEFGTFFEILDALGSY